jgi:trehalose 6-phosphate synthase
MSRLVVVSNRVAMPDKAGGASVGGLTMALAAALQQYRGVWFGWSGETTPAFTGEAHVRETSGVTIATIDLEAQDVQEYYNGYANTVLWPLFHYRIDLTEYERAFGEGYARVNARFAETLLSQIRPDDMIWVHDYHLIPLAQELRRRGLKNRIGFFLHIPWPACQLMTTLPRHQELVEALFAYDLVGFQTQDWLSAFHGYVTDELGGAVHGDGQVSAFGRTVRAGAFPIGIDADNFAEIVKTPAAAKSYDRAAATNVYRDLIIGVDRIDYSKGLEERFTAFEQFLKTHPEFRERVAYLQIAQTSRSDVEAYQDIRTRLDGVAGRINAAYGTLDWTPLRYVNRSYGRDFLAGVYRAAKIGLVTPLRDGMNLVAKEYVAAQNPRDPGVLVLSRFAGAARQMKAALIVNPYSREDVADAIKRGLTMSQPERIQRWEALMAGVQAEDVSAWRDSFVAALKTSQSPPCPSPDAAIATSRTPALTR